jgi:Cu-Zn family superoxide dismutase
MKSASRTPRASLLAALLCVASPLPASGQMHHEHHEHGNMMEHLHVHGAGGMITATAVLVATSGSSVSGTLKLHEIEDGMVHITGTVTGLTPGKHGIHIHVNGNCDSPDGMSAGGHFSPTGGKHGSPDAEEHHLGDLGNIEADASGRVEVDILAHGVSLALMGPKSIDGRAIVIHAKEDDFSDPVGNSGARVGCGVIEGDMMRM